MKGFHVALDVEQGRAQLVGHVADEATLGRVQFHFAGEVLHRHGDALEAFAAGIAYRLEHDSQGASRFTHAAAHIGIVALAAGHVVERRLQLHGQALGQFVDQPVALQVATLPAEQPAGGGVGQHDGSTGIEQHGTIGHGGDQRLLLHLGRGELFDVGGLVHLQLGGHGVEALQQFPQFAAHRQGDPGLEIAAGDLAHAPQQFLHRLGDRERVEYRAQDHQHPDRDEHRHGHLAGEGGTGQQGFVGIDTQSQHPQVAPIVHHRHEHVGDLAVRGEVLAHQRVVRPVLDVAGQLQAAAQQQLAAAVVRADRNAEVDHPVGIGKKDVAQAAAGTPEAVGHRGQFAVVALGHQRRHVG